MTGAAASLVKVAARLLEPDEREAVLGDLAEAGETAGKSLVEILGLAARRQIALWNDWRPWAATFAVTLPGTLLLMGVSLSISCTYQRLASLEPCPACAPTSQEDFVLLLCQVLLLIAWSWSSGFVVGSVSQRTLWASIAWCLLPCAFCLVRFRDYSVSRLCLLLFLPPAILGAHHALRIVRIKPAVAFALALAVTVLMICAWSNRALWSLNWALIFPAWYIAALAWRDKAWRMSSN